MIAALRRVIQDNDVATMLHYPCGDMAWAGPVITAVQVGRGQWQGSGLVTCSPMQRVAQRALEDCPAETSG